MYRTWRKTYKTWSLVLCTIIYLSKITCAREVESEEILVIDEDIRRPIWNIAHMVNALYQVDYYLDRGANGIEFDISFDWDGTAKYTYHGLPCDCFRSCIRYEYIETYLEYVQKLTTPGNPQYRQALVLLFLDVKVRRLSNMAKIRAGEDLATKLLDHYWKRGSSGAAAFILVSVPSVNDIGFVESFKRKLMSEGHADYEPKIGFDFSGNEDLNYIQHVCKSMKIDAHIWQGDGITNCLPRGTGRLREAIIKRDQSEIEFIDKVYWWTVDKMSTMRTTLSLGIDGMITNHPDRLISVLNEEQFSSKLRLATYEDNPWANYVYPFARLISDTQHVHEGNTTYQSSDDMLYNC